MVGYEANKSVQGLTVNVAFSLVYDAETYLC